MQLCSDSGMLRAGEAPLDGLKEDWTLTHVPPRGHLRASGTICLLLNQTQDFLRLSLPLGDSHLATFHFDWVTPVP